jgi:hypothetical protein
VFLKKIAEFGEVHSWKPKVAQTHQTVYILQETWGAHNTHNTYECKKWDQHGCLKKTFKSKARSNSETPQGENKSYAQLYAENKQLKANHKNSKKAHKNKKKNKYESDSDSSYDSDSS